MKQFFISLILFVLNLSASGWEIGVCLQQSTIPQFYFASNSISRYLNYSRSMDGRVFVTPGLTSFSSNDYDSVEISNENVRQPYYWHDPQLIEVSFRLGRKLSSSFSLFGDLGLNFGLDRQNSFTKYLALAPGTTNRYMALLQISSLDKLYLILPSFSLGIKYQNPDFHFLKMTPYESLSSGIFLLASAQANTHLLTHLDENIINGNVISFSNLNSPSLNFVRTLSEEADITTSLRGYYLQHQVELGMSFHTSSNTTASLGIGVELINLFVTSGSKKETYTSAEANGTPILMNNGEVANYLEYQRTPIITDLTPYSLNRLGFKLIFSLNYLLP